MIRRPPRSTQSRSSAASDVYKRQVPDGARAVVPGGDENHVRLPEDLALGGIEGPVEEILDPVSYTHLRAHETVLDLVCRLLLEKKKEDKNIPNLTCLILPITSLPSTNYLRSLSSTTRQLYNLSPFISSSHTMYTY